MKQLKVLAPFRDLNNYFTLHEVGSTITVNNEGRATYLIKSGLCEEIKRPLVEKDKVEKSDSTTLEESTEAESMNVENMVYETPLLDKKRKSRKPRKKS